MKVNCLKIANDIYSNVKKDLQVFFDHNILPKIVIIKMINSSRNDKYIDIKVKKAIELGIKIEVIQYLQNQQELILYIEKLNRSRNVHGYIIQFPLPKEINIKEVLSHVNPLKDLDGLSYKVIAQNHIIKDNPIIPATANAVMKIIKNQKYNLSGKHVVILNRSLIVGKPLMNQFINHNATVTICNSLTKNLHTITNLADVLVVAIGRANFIKKRSIKKNSFVIDVGINNINGKVCGDVDTKQIESQAKYFTTVPNGVGVITVACIFENLINLLKLQNKQNNDPKKII